MNSGSFLWVGLISAAVCLLACEPFPKNSVDDARTALEKAEKSGARSIAARQLDLGHVYYDSAMKLLEVEKKKLPFRRSYKTMIGLLDLASEAGAFALESQQTERGVMRDEFQVRLDLAKSRADSLDSILMAAANKKKAGNLKVFLDSARTAQKEAEGLIGSEDLSLAEEKVIAAEMKTTEAANKISASLALRKKRTSRHE